MKLAPDEGDLAIHDARRYVCKLSKEFGISREQQRIIREAIRTYSGRTVIRRIGNQPRVECTPYVVCFTTLDMRQGWSRKTRKISCRDLRIEFCVPDMGLDIPKNYSKSLAEADCSNAIQIVGLRYPGWLHRGPDEMEYDIRLCFKEFLSGAQSIEEMADVIARIVCGYRVTRLGRRYKGQRETRLVFYVPEKGASFPEVMSCVRKKKGAEDTEDDSRYIYIDFSSEKRDLSVQFDCKNGHT